MRVPPLLWVCHVVVKSLAISQNHKFTGCCAVVFHSAFSSLAR